MIDTEICWRLLDWFVYNIHSRCVVATAAAAALCGVSVRFNSHFPGEPGLAVFIEAKDDGGGGDNCSYKWWNAPVKSSPPTNQHPVFLQAWCPSCRPTNSVKALKGKCHIPCTCLPQAHLGVFQVCPWPLIAPVYLGDSCHASHQPTDASSVLPMCVWWRIKLQMSMSVQWEQPQIVFVVPSASTLQAASWNVSVNPDTTATESTILVGPSLHKAIDSTSYDRHL